jgi:hypothetical protein
LIISGETKMGLSEKKEEQLRKMPQIETKIFKSKDGKLLINKTIITAIKPVAYYEAVISSEGYTPEAIEEASI